MKTKKLNLNDLKVDSFVTSLEGKREETLKGGAEKVPTSQNYPTMYNVCGGCSPWLSLDTGERCKDLSIVIAQIK